MSRELVHQWTITVVTGAHGVLAVDPISTIRFATSPLLTWLRNETGSFSVTIHDKSDGGPYTQLLARLLPPTPAGSQSQSLATNMTVDTFSFTREDVKVDLTQRGDRVRAAGTTSVDAGGANSPAGAQRLQADDDRDRSAQAAG